MKKKVLPLAFVLGILVSGGCINITDKNDQPEVQLSREDIEVKDLSPPTGFFLSAYGEVLDFSRSGGFINLKIGPGIVDCELTVDETDILADASYFDGNFGSPEICNIFLFDTFIYDSKVDSFDDLEIGKEYIFPDIPNCGKVIEFNTTPTVPPHRYAKIEPVIKDGSDYVQENHFTAAFLPISFDEIEGMKLVFDFFKEADGDPWTISDMYQDMERYVAMCESYHRRDLIMYQTLSPGEGATAERIEHTFLIPDKATDVKVLLANNQDNEIKYRINDVRVINEHASKFYGNRESEIVFIDGCEVDFDTSPRTIPAKSEEVLNFPVTCAKDINMTFGREVCDNYLKRENCRTVFLDETGHNALALWGEIEYTDELGNRHTFPNKGIFKQFLDIGGESSLNVEYSSEISKKGEFYIYADYRDSQGNKIEGARVNLRFKNFAKIDDFVFTMRYDSKKQRYKFQWSDFHEWDPGYEKGSYEFTVTAGKAGYATQKQSYTFELR